MGNSDEKFDDDGKPLWPRRNTEHRPKEHEKYVALLINRLDNLEASTRPSSGAITAAGKDFKAFQALLTAGNLVEALAGWAIDHQAGLASKALSFVPRQPSGTKNHPEYIDKLAAVDDHEHEKHGARLALNNSDPALARAVLLNLLRCNSGGFSGSVLGMAINGLQSLAYGDVDPIFKPANVSRKVSWRELDLQMRAIALVEYRTALGMRKYKAQEEVAAAYCVSPDTLQTWKKRLRDEFGGLEVARMQSFARNAASFVEAARKNRHHDDADETASWHELNYGSEALKAASEAYRNR